MYRLCFVLFFGLAVCWNIGCSPAPKGAAPATGVKGTVNIDGKPIPTGEIAFGMPGVPSKYIAIKDGSFAGDAPIGKNQVEIFIYKDGPPLSTDPGKPTKINTTLPKYHGPTTTLDATVNATGTNEFKFDITSK